MTIVHVWWVFCKEVSLSLVSWATFSALFLIYQLLLINNDNNNNKKEQYKDFTTRLSFQNSTFHSLPTLKRVLQLKTSQSSNCLPQPTSCPSFTTFNVIHPLLSKLPYKHPFHGFFPLLIPRPAFFLSAQTVSDLSNNFF